MVILFKDVLLGFVSAQSPLTTLQPHNLPERFNLSGDSCHYKGSLLFGTSVYCDIEETPDSRKYGTNLCQYPALL